MAIALSVDECLSLEMCTLNYSVSHHVSSGSGLKVLV